MEGGRREEGRRRRTPAGRCGKHTLNTVEPSASDRTNKSMECSVQTRNTQRFNAWLEFVDAVQIYTNFIKILFDLKVSSGWKQRKQVIEDSKMLF